MKNLVIRTLMVLGLVSLAACSTAIRSNVASFHEMTVPGGERVAIMPILEEKSDSLEYRQYAGILAGHLQSYGYKQAGDNDPQLIAGFDVSISDGREKLRTIPSAGRFNRPYWYRGFWSYGRFWTPIYPIYHDPFDDTELVARTVYTATLTFELRTPDGKLVYEGRADAETRRKDLPAIVPYLAAALFEDFPGENGVTRSVSVDLEKRSTE